MQIKCIKKKSLLLNPTILLRIHPRFIKIKEVHVKLILRLLILTVFMAEKKENNSPTVQYWLNKSWQSHSVKYNTAINTLHQNTYWHRNMSPTESYGKNIRIKRKCNNKIHFAQVYFPWVISKEIYSRKLKWLSINVQIGRRLLFFTWWDLSQHDHALLLYQKKCCFNKKWTVPPAPYTLNKHHKTGHLAHIKPVRTAWHVGWPSPWEALPGSPIKCLAQPLASCGFSIKLHHLKSFKRITSGRLAP